MSTKVKGVIDLRAYAAAAPPTGNWLAGRLAAAHSDPLATVTAFAPTGAGRIASMPHDEFVLALAGAVSFHARNGETRLAAGQGAVLPAGAQFDWRAANGTTVVVMACPTAASAGVDVVAIDLQAPLAPSNPPLAQLLVGPTPACRNHSDFRSASGEFVCGTWDSTPYHRRPMPYRHIELMHLLEGAVTFEDAGGAVSFSRGDTLLCARGAECAWISTVHVKKIYATQRPA